jgi:3-oxoacyl-[acyl-carrier-protein] synthase II
MAPAREVVITGAGVVSPIGLDLATFWRSLASGRSGVRPISALPASHLPVTFAGEITDFDGKQYITPRKSLKVMSREIQFSVAAANMAVRQSELLPGGVAPERLGVIFGAELMHSPTEEVEAAYRDSVVEGRFDFRRWGEAAMRDIYPLWMLKYLPNMPACHIGIAHDARGPNNTITLGDVSGLSAIIEAARVIERGQADAMIAGGAGSCLSATIFTRLQKLDVSHRNDAPEEACRPFDAARDGRVHGEGAAAFVLELAETARARGARILARFRGGATCCAPSRAGDAVRRAVRGTLRAAEWSPDDVGHVNAHGASTKSGDAMEAMALQAELGETPVTAPSSFFGSLGPGSGAVEMLATVLGLAHDAVPPTLNFEKADRDCPVNVVHGEPLHGAHRRAIVLNYAPHGQAVALALSGAND